MCISRKEKQHRHKWWMSLKTVISSPDRFLLFSLSIWNLTSLLKTPSAPRSPVCTITAWRGKTAAGSHRFSFRFQAAFLRLITNSQNHNSSKTLMQFRALTDHDKCNVRGSQAANRWQDMDLLFTFIKAIVFEVTLFLFCCVRSVLQSSAWKTIQLKVGERSPSGRRKNQLRN